MPYPSKRSPRQQPSRRHRRAIPSRRCRSLRWSSSRLRTAAPTPLAAAGLKALLRCRSPGAESLLPAVLSRCSPGLHPEEGGWKMLPRRLSGQAAQSRDRNRSPGRTRVHPVYRPRSDLDVGATGPRLIRRILWGSVHPEGDLATALQRAGRAGSVRRHGVATPHPGQRAANNLLSQDGPKSLSLSLMSQVCTACPTCIGRSNREGSLGDASRNDAASAGPATSTPGPSRGFLKRKSW